MRLYLAMARISFQEALQYRVESAIFFFSGMVPPFMMAYLWLVAYEDQSSVAGYALGEMLTYTIAVVMIRGVISSRVEWSLDYEIRQGTLSGQLTRPFDCWGYLLVESVASKAARLFLVVPATLGGVLWLSPHLTTISLPRNRVPPLAISIVLAFVVSFLVKLCVEFVGFWTNDIVGVVTVYGVIKSVVGGILVPITLLPEGVQTVARLLPMYAIYTVPLSILLGKVDGTHIWLSVGLQVAWTVVLWGLVLWRAGLRQYEAVGG